jgi:hypothetical protein
MRRIWIRPMPEIAETLGVVSGAEAGEVKQK